MTDDRTPSNRERYYRALVAADNADKIVFHRWFCIAIVFAGLVTLFVP